MGTCYNHLSREQRDIIEASIGKGYIFTQIGDAIGKDRTTVSKEIRRNRYIKLHEDHFNQELIQKFSSKCARLSAHPYCCNHCPNIRYCNKGKIYYNAKVAHERYEKLLITSREGIDINPETIDEIEHSIVPLIKEKKQSVNQVYINHHDILYFSKTTFYKYVETGVFSLTNLDLPKKVKYKKRKKANNNRRELAILKGRKYTDFCEFKVLHPNMHIYEMDTVIGKNTTNKVFLTIFFRDTHYMIIRLLEKKNIACVNAEFERFKDILGIKLYAKIFRIGLTDNGSEFLDPYHIEKDYNNDKKITNLFYCDPNQPNQKGGIEKNHEYIRSVLPTGTSFDELTEKQVRFLESQINNIPRESLNGKTPYELTKKHYSKFIELVGCDYIPYDEVTLNIKDLLGVKNEQDYTH